MRFLALDMGDETHAAGVMLVGGVVQTLGFVQNHAGFGRMGFAGGGILHSALLGARSWTIPVFPCCLKCLERRCPEPTSTHLGGKPRKRVVDCASGYVGAKHCGSQPLQQNEMDAAPLRFLVEPHQLLHALRRDPSYGCR